jgi:hypothetical protein
MAHGSHLGGSTGIPPDLLQQILDAGVADDRMGMVGHKVQRGAALLGTPGAQGMNVGGTYKAASPLEHLSTAMSRMLGAKMQRDAHGEMEGLLGQKIAGRRAMGEAQAGLFTPPTAEALNAPEPPAFQAPNFVQPDLGFGVDGVTETPARALARAMDERSRLGGIAALSGDPAIAASGQGLLADARTMGAQQFETAQNKTRLLENRATREAEREFRQGERADERAWREAQAAEARAFQAQQAEANRGAALERAQTMAGRVEQRKEGDRERKLYIGEDFENAGGDREVAPPVIAQAQKQVIDARRVLTNIDRIDELLDKNPNGALVGDDAVRLASLVEAIKLREKEIQGLGVLNGQDYEILSRMVADPTSAREMLQSGAGVRPLRTAFGALRALTLSDANEQASSLGFKAKEGSPFAPKAKAPALSAQDQAAKTWAESNPNDPRAAEILRRLAAKGS